VVRRQLDERRACGSGKLNQEITAKEIRSIEWNGTGGSVHIWLDTECDRRMSR
jgi:hypothetical protein